MYVNSTLLKRQQERLIRMYCIKKVFLKLKLAEFKQF